MHGGLLVELLALHLVQRRGDRKGVRVDPDAGEIDRRLVVAPRAQVVWPGEIVPLRHFGTEPRVGGLAAQRGVAEDVTEELMRKHLAVLARERIDAARWPVFTHHPLSADVIRPRIPAERPALRGFRREAEALHRSDHPRVAGADVLPAAFRLARHVDHRLDASTSTRARFEHAYRQALLLEDERGIEAGEARADDDHVERLRLRAVHGTHHRGRSNHGQCRSSGDSDHFAGSRDSTWINATPRAWPTRCRR